MIKGFVFDLDGVLVFTDHFHYLSWKAIADEEGIEFNEQINNQLRGVSRKDSLEIILRKASKTYTEDEKDALCEKKNNIYKTYLDTMSEKDVDPDTIETLKQLKAQGYKIALGSSSKNAKYILNKVGLTPYFDAISDGVGLVHSKPDPEVFLKASDMLKINPKELVVVEDAEAGINAANAGKFISVGIGEASKYEKTQISIERFSDLLKVAKANSGIVIEDLCKEYTPGVKAVKDVNLVINDKEFLVLVGPSGCGKSTILRMIAGLEEISGGRIYIGGKLINDVEPKDRNIAMVFQNYALFPNMTVAHNIGFCLKISKVLREKDYKCPTSPKKLRNLWYKVQYPFVKKLKYRHLKKEEIDEKVKSVAEILGLTQYLDRKPGQLSGGQRQRVALGRAIIRNPEVFLFDEPLSNLDAKMRATMRTEITKLHNRLQTTFIYVTHDQVEAMTMGTKIVVLKDGVVQQYDTPANIYNRPANKFVAGFIGTPQMNFIDAKYIDSQLTIGSKTIDLTKEFLANQDVESLGGGNVCVGIRPRSVKVMDQEGYDEKYAFEGTVNVSEQLGDEVLLYLTVEGKDGDFTIAGNPKKQYKIGDKVKFSINPNEIHLFNPVTEKTLYISK